MNDRPLPTTDRLDVSPDCLVDRNMRRAAYVLRLPDGYFHGWRRRGRLLLTPALKRAFLFSTIDSAEDLAAKLRRPGHAAAVEAVTIKIGETV